jgi:hypothetical protein
MVLGDEALALAQVVLNTTDTSVTPSSRSLNQTDPVLIARSISIGSSFASAEADLSAGILRGYAESALPPTPSNTSSVRTISLLGDSFSFSAGATGTAYLNWSFAGTLSVVPNKPQVVPFATAFLDINLFPVGGGATLSFEIQLTSGPSCAPAATVCRTGTSVSEVGRFAMPINPTGYVVQALLTTVGGAGDVARFNNTSRLYLDLPAGVSIASASGVFLQTAVPIPGVPEPPVVVTLVLGGALLLAQRRLRRA